MPFCIYVEVSDPPPLDVVEGASGVDRPGFVVDCFFGNGWNAGCRHHAEILGAAVTIWYRLRVESLHRPVFAAASVEVPLVQPSGSRFPEFDPVGSQAKSGPEWRARDFLSFKSLLDFGDSLSEIVGVLDRLALNRRPRTYLAFSWTAREVRVSFGIRHN